MYLQVERAIHVSRVWLRAMRSGLHRIEGDGCGAAMRVAPMGIVYSCARTTQLIEAVYQASIPTHGGQFGICAAVAFAAAVSAAIDGKSSHDILQAALVAARDAERLRPPGSAGNAAVAVETMYGELLAARNNLPARLAQDDCFPDRPAVIVPLAIGLALVTGSAVETVLLAANIGGDTDSVASIGGALAAAMFPDTVNEAWFEAVERVNNHRLVELAGKLVGIRQ